MVHPVKDNNRQIGHIQFGQIGRPLRNYHGKVPVSNKLNSDIERISSIGQPLSMSCSSETAIEKCTWTSPSGFTFEAHTRAHTTQYTIQPKIISSDENICKIQIGHLNEAQLGKWTCQIKLEGTVFFPF